MSEQRVLGLFAKWPAPGAVKRRGFRSSHGRRLLSRRLRPCSSAAVRQHRVEQRARPGRHHRRPGRAALASGFAAAVV